MARASACKLVPHLGPLAIRPAKQYVPYIRHIPGFRCLGLVEAKSKCGEQVARILARARCTPDRYVVAEAVVADVAAGRDVGDEVAPEADDVVFEIGFAAVFERH